MSYYISAEGTVQVSQVVKRLGDFKGKEGQRYTVRKRKKVEMLDMLPTYESRNGKLVKLEEMQGFWL